MRRKSYKALGLVLSCSMLLAACGNSDTAKNMGETESKTEIGSVDEENQEVKEYYRKYDSVITLTQNFQEDNVQVEQVPDGMSFDHNYWTDWCRDTYGIEWKTKWISTSEADNEQKMNLALVSDDLPDVVVTKASQMRNLIDAGKVQPLDKLIDQYGIPLVKYVLDTVESTGTGIFAPFSKEGTLYALPSLQDIWATVWNNNWIRQDILTELDMEIPETVEDLEAVIEAYKKVNPDAIALVLSAGNSTNISGMQTITDAYGAYPMKWLVNDDGELVYGSIQPEMKEALQKLNEWYQNGWIDTEFVVKDMEKAYEAVVQGNAINFYHSWSAVWSPIPDLLMNDPNAEMVAYEPLKGSGEGGNVVVNNLYNNDSKCYAINANCEYPEAVIYLFNVFMDNYYRNNEEMRTLMKEEYQYDLMFEPYEIQQPNNLDTAETPAQYTYDYPADVGGGVLNGYGMQFGLKMNQGPTELLDQYYKMSEVEEGVRDESELKELDITEKEKYIQPTDRWSSLLSSVRLYKEMEENGRVVYDGYAGALTDTMQEKNAYLQKLELETFTNIIMGQEPIEEFDAFVENWMKAGGEDIIAEVNEWYRSVN